MNNLELDYLAKKALSRHLSTVCQFFNSAFPMPNISFQLRGKAAGKAYLTLWEIRLNPVLFYENRETYLNEVIPHELAHLIAFKIYGRVKPHGKEWQSIMREVFSLPAKTTHTLPLDSVQGTTFEYQCACSRYPLTIRRHNKIKKGISEYRCRNCQQPLNFTGIQLS